MIILVGISILTLFNNILLVRSHMPCVQHDTYFSTLYEIPVSEKGRLTQSNLGYIASHLDVSIPGPMVMKSITILFQRYFQSMRLRGVSKIDSQ